MPAAVRWLARRLSDGTTVQSVQEEIAELSAAGEADFDGLLSEAVRTLEGSSVAATEIDNNALAEIDSNAVAGAAAPSQDLSQLVGLREPLGQ